MLQEVSTNKYVSSELYCAQNQGLISNSITQSWTEQARECYELNCTCSKCSVSKGNYSFICQMPKVIKQLLKVVGKPVV
ncbi:hypothetical protein IJG14_00085 [bacterium]|nr:hypothetical protein [bacterium]